MRLLLLSLGSRANELVISALMKDSTSSIPKEKLNCCICENPVETDGYITDFIVGRVCSDCHAVEQRGWKEFANGSAIILLAWLFVRILYWRGTIGPLLPG